MGMDVVKQAVETIKRMYNLSLLKLLERLPVENGGTGGATAEQARENLGIHLPLAVEDGGTGADSAAGARETLGIQFPLPIANGGTGGTTASAALTNLGLPVTYGTWTPKLIASGGGMTYTTSYSYAYYYRIGDLVYITLYMKVNVTAAGTNYARIQGLPFTPRSGFYYALARAMFATGSYNNNTDGASAFISTATNTIHIQSANGTGALKWSRGDTWVGWSGCYVKAQ